MNDSQLAPFAGQKYLNLESYRKNGQAVQTPLWFVEENGVLYVYSLADAWKVKRVRNNGKAPAAIPKGVPEKVMKILKYVDDHEAAMDGYEGGRTFGNFEKRLPQTDGKGQRIKYREWDVNPLKPGVNRGAERLVTGSDGSAHYTDDHYSTFKKIR